MGSCMSVRGWGIVAVVSLTVAIGASIVGSVLESRGPVVAPVRIGIIATAVAAFLGLAVALPPLGFRAFLAGQVAIGNGSRPIIGFLLRHETNVVRGFWLLMVFGTVLALPHVLRAAGWKG